jgi:hypothetical protein
MIEIEKVEEVGKGQIRTKTQAGGQKRILWTEGLPHAVRPLSWSELPVDAGGYRSAKIKYFN